MRKFFSLLAAVLFAGSMMAEEATMTAGTNGSECTVNDVAGIKCGTSKAGGDMTITVGAGATKLSFYAAAWKGVTGLSLNLAADGVTFSPASVSLTADDGISNNTPFTLSGLPENFKFEVELTGVTAETTIAVTSSAAKRFVVWGASYEAGEAPAVATPVISGEAEFTESTEVSISCTTEGAAIYYTLDGADPTTNSFPYDDPFTLNETATVKAVAYDSENNQYSAVATKTFTKKEPLVAISCAEVYQKAKGTELALNNVVVAYANAKNVYVQDETGSMLLYLTQNTTWEAGNILSGVEGTLDIYNDLYEVKMTEAQVAAVQPGQGEAPAPVEFTAAPVVADMNKYILLKNVKVDTIAFPSSKNMNATIGGETFVLRNNFNADVAFDTTKLYDITGVVSVYKGAVQVYFISATEAETTPILGVETIYDWAGEIGTTFFGGNSNITTGTVKIHENTDEVNGIKFGSSYVYADGKYIAIKPAEGGFKAGDEISLSVVFNNSDLTKYCMADVYAADKTTRLFRSDSASTLNGQNVGEPIVQTYTLASDQDSLLLGRYGNTGMFITLLKVTRALVPPTPEHTYTVAGGSDVAFGTTWAPSNEANDMTLVEGLYTWEKADLTLAAGNIEFKVCEDHAWTVAYPAQNYVLNIPEAGIYTITITFNAETKEVNAVATKTGEAVVVPTVAMHGNFLGSWADTENFAIAQDNASASLTITLAEGNYEFGMRIGGSGNWTANGANLTREANTTNLAEGSGNMHIAADVTGDYVFTYTYETQVLEVVYPEAPVVGDTIVIDIEQEVQYTDYVAEAGWWQFMADNDEYSISISNVSTTQAAGTYTIADLDADYTYLLRLADSTEIHFVAGSFVLTEGADGSRTIEGVVTGDDEKIYSIKLVFRIPTPETTVNVEIPEWGVADASQYYGLAGYVFYGETEDENIYVQIVIPGTNPVGQFTYDDVYARGTGIEVGGEYKSIYSMNITINVSDAGRAIITADILCYNNTLYHVTTHIGEGINAVEAAQKAVKMIQNGQVVIIKNGVHYNINGAVVR